MKRKHAKINTSNKICFFDCSAQGDGKLPRWLLDTKHITETNALEGSDLVVSKWPGRHRQLIHWHAVLTGACIASPMYVASAGEAGSCLSFLPAIRSKRFVWVSDTWQNEHPNLMQIMSSAFRHADCKWERLQSKQDFLASTEFFVNRARAQIRKFSAIALVSAQEKVHEDPCETTVALCEQAFVMLTRAGGLVIVGHRVLPKGFHRFSGAH